MYRKNNPDQMSFENFHLPFGGKLNGENRWVLLADQIPWQHIDQQYSQLFESATGCPATQARVAFAALIIQERLGTTDRETVQQIIENPYLQYFLGYGEYTDKPPFHHTTMSHFRKRFTQEALSEINNKIVTTAKDKHREESSDDRDDNHKGADNDDSSSANSGKLLVDATCTPSDITYPTDLNLLNDARQKTEEIIDSMHMPLIGKRRKVRTYRQKARSDYLSVAKQKRPGYKKIRKAIGKQLRYLSRNLQNIEKLAEEGFLCVLSNRSYRNLLVIQELYRQQLWMYENNSHKISGRIVNITQPHVRPIVRGKARDNVEFGAKVSASLVDGFVFVDRIGWEPYNETADLMPQIESYRDRFGFYPESVHADKIYRTRVNRQYCKQRGIRLSGPPLGRPVKETAENKAELKSRRDQMRQDEIDRIPIEGKFGQGKRRFGLGLVMSKLASTSETAISVAFIVMNLERILSLVQYFLLLIPRMVQRWLAVLDKAQMVYRIMDRHVRVAG